MYDDECDANSPQGAVSQCIMLQSLIDISAGHLNGLRTQCAISAELTQQEIRTLEGKLIKLFSRQLLFKKLTQGDEYAASQLTQYPQLDLWLKVVGLKPESIGAVLKRISSLQALLDKTDKEVGVILGEGSSQEERRRLVSALQNLEKYTDYLLRDDKASLTLDLHWDSWDRTNPNGTPCSSGAGTPVSAAESNIWPITTSANNSNCSRFNIPIPSTPKTAAVRSARGSIPSEDTVQSTPVSPPLSTAPSPWSPPPSAPLFHQEQRYTPPATPPVSLNKKDKLKFPTTPPPKKKLQATTPVGSGPVPSVTGPGQSVPGQGDGFPLTKSKSHESHLANRVEINSESGDRVGNRLLTTDSGCLMDSDMVYPGTGHSQTGNGGSRAPSGHASPLASSPMRSPPYSIDQVNEDTYRSTLPVPKSPRTPGMGHNVPHRFTKTLKVTTCDYCQKQMFIGFKCKDCKFKCHRDCADKVPPSCRLPAELLDVFIKLQPEGSPIIPRPVMPSPSAVRIKDKKRGSWVAVPHSAYQLGGGAGAQSNGVGGAQHPIPIPPFVGHDSGSNTSSCNSSTPSSPAIIVPGVSVALPVAAAGGAYMSLQHTPASSRHQHLFDFPDVGDKETMSFESRPYRRNDMVETQKSNDSDRTVSGTSGSISTDSEKTLAGRVDSQDSQVSDADGSDRTWPRQNSLSLREWDIPFDELHMEEIPIGQGRFGNVYRGNWHGDVAVKVLNMEHMDDERTLEAFKQEVAVFRKTRHENLVLFMGACMKPPHLAIVTSLCKGNTLYTHIHLRKDKFNMSKTVHIAMQILQGMSYLHARGIVHKDLKTKNVFFESNKVIITDFGLFNLTKLCGGSGAAGEKGNNRWLKADVLAISPGWLCYLSPEIMRALRIQPELDELPFSNVSDVYAFGTVWYELLCGEYPFKGLPPEAIIWQVGRGVKQSLAHIQASKDVKDILMLCWTMRSNERPQFGALLKMMEKLPKKRLARSPSHPVHLSRSAESVF